MSHKRPQNNSTVLLSLTACWLAFSFRPANGFAPSAFIHKGCTNIHPLSSPNQGKEGPVTLQMSRSQDLPFYNNNDDGDEIEGSEDELLFEYQIFEEDDVSESLMNSPNFDLDELHDRIREVVEADQPLDVAEFIQMEAIQRMKNRTAPRPSEVHIILFYPDTEDEGVHTVEFPPGSGNNVILGFESLDECRHFAEILKQQDFFDPQPEEMNLEALETYCKALEVKVQIVPEGTNLEPPESNVESLTHNPELRATKSSLDRLFEIDATDVEVGISDLGAAGSWE
eukprot:CAMPEP_0116035414 /NCGR_PEP_ID=MMETSP0321-20121206/20354_1 /TAXON_ID=163516 /ORGANISM="Leptocylindrus danicus var. danicus, Strain B650" /LENGTH=283 /DNA_ID=CAMNT_0003512243 /DNA_START=195 /DNA_END=1046 /DNA_ORIENTATION=+